MLDIARKIAQYQDQQNANFTVHTDFKGNKHDNIVLAFSSDFRALNKHLPKLREIFGDRSYDISFGWRWVDCQSEEYKLSFRNTERTYSLSVYSGDAYRDVDVLKNVPNTIDELASIDLFQLSNAMNAASNGPDWRFSQYGYNQDHLALTFYSFSQAEAFNEVNPFQRRMSWKLPVTTDDDEVFVCKLYFSDVVNPDIVPFDKIKKRFQNKIHSKKNVQLTAEELYELTKAGKISFADFKSNVERLGC